MWGGHCNIYQKIQSDILKFASNIPHPGVLDEGLASRWAAVARWIELRTRGSLISHEFVNQITSMKLCLRQRPFFPNVKQRLFKLLGQVSKPVDIPSSVGMHFFRETPIGFLRLSLRTRCP